MRPKVKIDIFEKLANKIKSRVLHVVSSLIRYIKKLLFPLYLFPIKLVTYSTYYILKFIIKLLFAMAGLIIDFFTYPFKSLKNFLKSIVFGIIGLWFVFTSLATLIVLVNQYGNIGNLFCSNPDRRLKETVVRVIGGYGEGSGFFIADNEVLTNFHVIADEPSPKIVFPDSHFETPSKIVGNKEADLAILRLDSKNPEMVWQFYDFENDWPYNNELITSAGYPLGTEIKGEATVVRGRYLAYRGSKKYPVSYIQSDINLVKGMSGGPLVTQCGKVIG